jgi:hypothetical protein
MLQCRSTTGGVKGTWLRCLSLTRKALRVALDTTHPRRRLAPRGLGASRSHGPVGLGDESGDEGPVAAAGR